MNDTQEPYGYLTQLQRRRLTLRVARGMSLVQAAALEGIEPIYADALARNPEIVELIEDYRQRIADPEEERHVRLLEMAMDVLEAHHVVDDANGEPVILEEGGRTIN